MGIKKFIRHVNKLNIVVILSLFFGLSSAHATLITIETSSSSVSQHDLVTVDLWARDLSSDVVSAFDIDIGFDSSVMTFQTATFSTLLGAGLDSLQASVDGGNFINLAELSFLFDVDLFALQGGDDFMLASVTFSADSEGTHLFSLLDSEVYGSDFFAPSFAGPGNSISVNVTASEVPEPATLALLLIAFVSARLHLTNARLPG